MSKFKENIIQCETSRSLEVKVQGQGRLKVVVQDKSRSKANFMVNGCQYHWNIKAQFQIIGS